MSRVDEAPRRPKRQEETSAHRRIHKKMSEHCINDVDNVRIGFLDSVGSKAMSDGPYRSLPMKPRWRRAAKCAYKAAYSQEEIADALTRASHADFRAEVRSALINTISAIVAPKEPDLFRNQAVSALKALVHTCASPLEASLVNIAADIVAAGQFGAAALQQAVEDTISERLLRNYRQVEEHVRLDDSASNAKFVRARLEAAHGNINLAQLAQSALKIGPALPRRNRAPNTDLDAGVSL